MVYTGPNGLKQIVNIGQNQFLPEMLDQKVTTHHRPLGMHMGVKGIEELFAVPKMRSELKKIVGKYLVAYHVNHHDTTGYDLER